jgi:hypothetical protein
MDSGVVSVRCEYKSEDSQVVSLSGSNAVAPRNVWYSCVDLLSFPPGGVDPNQVGLLMRLHLVELFVTVVI